MLIWALTVGALHVFFVDENILGGTFEVDVPDSKFKISAQAGILGIACILLYAASHISFLRSK